jgi:hypothetical protein
MTADASWKVEPHGPLVMLDQNLWTVEGTIRMPPGPLSRRMTIARLGRGELVIFSAIALGEAEMAKIEQLGAPAFLVVPNGFHREDAPAWKARYPGLRVIAPAGARAMVEEAVPVDASDDVLADAAVQFITVPGTAEAESALLVQDAGGTTLVINDLIGNVQDARGVMRLVLTLMGFAGRRPQVPRMFAARAVKDKPALAGQFRRWAAIPDLRRIVVSHGAVIDTDAAATLSRLADGLR